ncbi:MAG: BamA/TamA family outer membrane protein [Acidobacteriia bacterium]|nr:BamA/TamA family outer membrane protein [Terriglobia bacterium]
MTRALRASWAMWLLFVTLYLPQIAAAQQDSRAAEIEAAREEKSQHLQPEKPSKTERALLTFKEKRVLERISYGIGGLRVKLGGMVQGGGFGIGPEYFRPDLAKGNLVFRTAAQASICRYQRYDMEFGAPHFARNKLFLNLFAVHHDYTGINYYGPGADSKRSSRTDFRIIDTSIDGTSGVQPVKHMKMGVSGGYLLVTLGPGQDTRFASTDQVFAPQQAIGIDTRPDFVRLGTFAEYDYRDKPGGPRTGGDYLIQFDRYLARPHTGNDFRRLKVDLQQYIPFFNQRRVLVLHAQSVLTYPDDRSVVPFYLQPVLGGSEDLRGFRSFRFYDNNLILVNGEYRWEVFSGLDMALFADSGKVFHRHADWNLRDMEADFGFGFRFNVRSNVFMRIDTGFSHEGFQVWFKFNNVFGDERIRSSRFQ